MAFANSKYNVMLQDAQTLNSPIVTQGERIKIVERFTYLGSWISSDSRVADEITMRILTARNAFANLRQNWSQTCLFLELKDRVQPLCFLADNFGLF